ncbi:hypothetical protein Igag_1131 [Ignisphaera aggregans DSM 17230]|uniref:Uncharacterized protein n=1 Tax=Ignisphaera aggregans (strain DSM 17230 / JCM 13409 / AQ1.S1) TaxID=583356 RepID=E0SNZ7_IGNAA|nr:hypothetical protein Igag_1131 [Ignisphaera aggregans DSM 17230]
MATDISWFLERFNPEKHKRLFLDVPQDMSRDDIKNIMYRAIKAFRKAIVEYLSRYRGYRIAKHILIEPEKYGPTPEIIWMRFIDEKMVHIIIGDSTILSIDKDSEKIFIENLEKYLKSQGFLEASAFLIDIDRYVYTSIRRVVYCKCRLP